MGPPKFLLLLGLVLMPLISSAEEVRPIDPRVQAAIDWQMPENKCKFDFRRGNDQSDLKRKYNRAVKKYKKCLSKYLQGLAMEQKKLMDVAPIGLTPAQADIIMGHMRSIQVVMETMVPASTAPGAAPATDAPTDTTEF